jgi:two-component system alkaline phosphatase synthesis response regulator PhoP
MLKTILIVDDEERLALLVKTYLEHDGYRAVLAANGRDALYLARQEKPDLIVLDIMMPELDGLEFLQLHRRECATPTILLTARVDDSDKVLGLDLGADDYLTKPFSPRELMARVRALLRRTSQAAEEPALLRAADITLDLAGHITRVNDRPVDLTPSEFDLLAALIAAPGRAFSRLELLERMQGTSYDGYERTVDVHIKNLRAKLEDDTARPRYVETVYGVGYRFCAQ